MKFEFYPEVPKSLQANLEYREKILTAAQSSKQLQSELWTMCSRDPLFYVNSFCFVFEPRSQTQKEIPFITWKYQDVTIETLIEAMGKHDVVIEKSRDMGASWMCLLAFDWYFLFKRRCNFMMLSRKEDLVDKTGSPDSLMWKIDFMHKNLPAWLLGNIERNRLMMRHTGTESVILGDSTSGDALRGGRYMAAFLDEFAAVTDGDKVMASAHDASPSLIINSTPQGEQNQFFKERTKAAKGGSTTKLISLHWVKHPEKGRDATFRVAPDGREKWTSPWYEAECKRRSCAAEIAQELDIDYLGSAYQFFDSTVLERIDQNNVRQPWAQGDYVDFDTDTLEGGHFEERAGGPLLLWVNPKVPFASDTEFILGCDLAEGTGASNTCFSGLQRKTGEKILEYVNPHLRPEDAARLAVALSRWLKNAFMIWEANGPGRAFGSKVLESGYRKIFYRQKEDSIAPRKTDFPGWVSTYGPMGTKRTLLGNYSAALKTGAFINRSKWAIDECRSYVYMPNGIVAHSASSGTDDPSGAADNHGDRVIADALCFRAMKEVSLKIASEQEVPRGSFEWRRRDFQDRKDTKKSW